MEDGSYVDVEDEEVTLSGDATIGIVHPLDLSEDQIDAWQQHLSDYEIEPHFSQG